MHLNDLLDTVLVTRKDESHPTNPSSAGSGAKTATSVMADNTPAASGDACPVDHKTRELWLQQARASGAASSNPHEGLPPHHPPTQSQQPLPPAPSAAAAAAAAAASSSSSSSSWSPWTWFSSSPRTAKQPAQSPTPRYPEATLDTTRTISSIPRSSIPGPSACPAPPSSTTTNPPSNHESETGADHATGNWIYPSEKMFFDAMRRKGLTAAQEADMKTVVPIHNAVNERAWAEIRAWEAPYSGHGGCADGPRLHSFAGVKERMTPRARMRTLLGYTAPFDRHDWVVDRCGKRVEYVIDFYAGRSDGAGEGKLNFFLDVRPKVNSWEGVKMRVLRGVGLA